MLKAAFWTIIVVAALIIGLGFAAARKSTAISPPAFNDDGTLPPCSKTPNCVTSEVAPDHAAYIKPIEAQITIDEMAAYLETMGGRVTTRSDTLIQAEFQTPLFKFTDDVMMNFDNRDGTFRIRSSSRIGKSDLGANRKRVEALRQLINSQSG